MGRLALWWCCKLHATEKWIAKQLHVITVTRIRTPFPPTPRTLHMERHNGRHRAKVYRTVNRYWHTLFIPMVHLGKVGLLVCSWLYVLTRFKFRITVPNHCTNTVQPHWKTKAPIPWSNIWHNSHYPVTLLSNSYAITTTMLLIPSARVSSDKYQYYIQSGLTRLGLKF